MRTKIKAILSLFIIPAMATSLNVPAWAYAAIYLPGGAAEYAVIGYNADSRNQADQFTDDACESFGDRACYNCYMCATNSLGPGVPVLLSENAQACAAVIPIKTTTTRETFQGDVQDVGYAFALGSHASSLDGALADARSAVPAQSDTVSVETGTPVARCSDPDARYAFVRVTADELMPSPVSTGGGSSSGGGGGGAGAVIGAVAVVGLGVYLLSSKEDSELSFSPAFDYSANESGYSAHYGGWADFQNDDWRVYWTAIQENADGEFGKFAYSSGVEYDGGFWTAKLSEDVRGDSADYDFALSADWRDGVWELSPEFAVESRYENGEFATTNSFRISGELRYNGWRFAANADNARFGVSAVLQF